MATFFGNSKQEFDADISVYYASNATNPSGQVYLEAFICDPSAGAAVTAVVSLELVFHAQLWGYTGPNQS